MNNAAQWPGAAARLPLRSSDSAPGQSWLQRTWRPITMLTFVPLIVARWLGWSAPNLGEAEVLKPWGTAESGPGAYVIGRTADKVLPAEVESLGKWEIDQAPAEGKFPRNRMPLLLLKLHGRASAGGAQLDGNDKDRAVPGRILYLSENN